MPFIDIITQTIIVLLVVPALLFLFLYEIRWMIGKDFRKKYGWRKIFMYYMFVAVVLVIIEAAYYIYLAPQS